VREKGGVAVGLTLRGAAGLIPQPSRITSMTGFVILAHFADDPSGDKRFFR
jgi:hypothetical protein